MAESKRRPSASDLLAALDRYLAFQRGNAPLTVLAREGNDVRRMWLELTDEEMRQVSVFSSADQRRIADELLLRTRANPIPPSVGVLEDIRQELDAGRARLASEQDCEKVVAVVQARLRSRADVYSPWVFALNGRICVKGWVKDAEAQAVVRALLLELANGLVVDNQLLVGFPAPPT